MSYHTTRFQYDRRRTIVWKELIRYLERKVPFGDTVLDVGCGYGEFINNVTSPNRFALDISPGQQRYIDPGISFVAADVMTSGKAFPPAAFDFIFSSNLLEHLERSEIDTLLGIFLTLLRPGGHLGILMPNYRLKPHLYFDDYTHKTEVSDVALRDWMASKGFEITLCEPGLMPYSMKESRLPVTSWLVRLWLQSPFKPGAGQMLVIGRRPPSSI